MTTKRESFPCQKCNAESNAPTGTARHAARLCKECYGKREDKRPNTLNNLTGAEWARASKSVEQYPDTRSKKQRDHGACFPKSLARQQIEIYTKKGDLVFDPFLGVGTTLDAALDLDRRAVGIELNAAFAEVAAADASRHGHSDARVIHDNSLNMLDYIETDTVDFILTSPPYANLLRNVKGAFGYKWREHSDLDPIDNPRPYSDYDGDIGNMSYEESLQSLGQIMSLCYRVQKPDTYAVWVVKDFRNLKQNKPYINFHGDVIDLGLKSGYTLWDIRIYDQTQFRPLVVLGYPSRNFYLNIGHSYLLVFRKLHKRSKRRKQ